MTTSSLARSDVDEIRQLGLTGLTDDSRAVAPGFLFAALPGTRTDGRDFIADAARRGAAAILAPEGTVLPPEAASIPLLTDPRPRRRFALLVAAFHARQPEIVVAVTGTNGKTSTALFAEQIWSTLGRRAASLGTLGLRMDGLERPGRLTTPDPVPLHETLSEIAGHGITRLAMEASSHGLALHRLDGVRVQAAGFTNLSRDHLDFHGSMSAYFEAKARLFDEVLLPAGTAVLNADAPEADALSQRALRAGRRVLTYGRTATDLRIIDAEPRAGGTRLSLTGLGLSRTVDLPLTGAFQALNALCALGLVLAADEVDPADAIDALACLRSVPGRLERVGEHPAGAAIYVDYAHTPDALAAALAALRAHTAGRLVLVFGCGGDRDPGKRGEMGAIAARLADRVIVTDDNPRSEAPEAIRAAVLVACPGGREIGDRAEAIAAAIGELTPGDTLLVAGKGHERGQIIGDAVRPFDDRETVRDLLVRQEGRAGGGER